MGNNLRISLSLSLSAFILFAIAAEPLTADERPGLLTVERAVQSDRFTNRHPALAAAHKASWQVRLDVEALYGSAAGPPRLMSAPAAADLPLMAGQSMDVVLPGLGRFPLEVDTLWVPDTGTMTYAGRIDGRPEWLFTLTVHDGEVLGSFYIGHRVYVLETEQETGRLLLYEIDRRRFPKDVHAHGHAHDGGGFGLLSSPQPPSCSNYQHSPQNGTVRVLFLHSNDVSSGINNLVQNIVTKFNQSAGNSGVALENFLTVAGIKEVNDDFAGQCRFPPLDAMINEQGEFSNLGQWRDNYNADIVFLLLDEDPAADQGDYCVGGLGRVGGIATILKSALYYPEGDGEPPYALSTVTWALGDLTAPHEIGHVLGGLHEGQEIFDFLAEAGVPACARGYVDDEGEWMTMMGGYTGENGCGLDNEPDPTKQSCVRQPFWSNPALLHDGQWAGDADEAFMARALNMTMPQAAEWRSYPTPVPSSAPTASSQSELCYGWNSISWTGVSGANVYQLVSSDSSNFSTQNRKYVGDALGLLVDVPQGQTRYYRVQACNGNGCGPWSNAVSASWFNGCM